MFNAANTYGAAPIAPSYQAPTSQIMAQDSIPGGLRGVLSPHNPLFWFGAVLLATFGALGVAGSVRLGEAKLSASVDRHR